MKTKVPLFVLSIALCPMFLFATFSRAETVTTKTVTKQSVPPGSTSINLADFDMNKDGILSSYEVGEMLFGFFDTNGNNSLDSKEYDARTILTVVPMEKETTITYDFDNDGIPDKVQSTYETFTQNTQLSRFGGNPNGLSPHEFLDQTFSAADKNDNGDIYKVEWRSAYIFKIAPVPVQ